MFPRWKKKGSGMSKATKITIHRADGSVWQAEDEDAAYIDLQLMAANHGMPYQGPFMKQVVGPTTKKSLSRKKSLSQDR
jgi:hypothetical protein